MMEQTILELEVYMKTTCPHCGIVGSAHDSMHGEKVRCPQCNKVFKVTEQKIACPHCGVIGSAGDSSIDMKFRCPQCKKVFLLTQELLTGPSARNVMPADETDEQKRALAEEASGIEFLAEEELLFPVPEPEPVLASVAEVVPEPEREVATALKPEPAAEIELVTEPEIEPEPELVVVAAPEPEWEPGIEPESEPELELVATAELEPELGMTSPYANANMPKDIKEKEAKAEELESTAISTRVCSVCGESYHPEFLQEIEGKLYCEVCELRNAIEDTQERSPKIGDGKLRGTIGALLLLGLLTLVVLALKMLGII